MLPNTDSAKRCTDAEVLPIGEHPQAPAQEPDEMDRDMERVGDPREFLRWLLDYEIRGSERYRRFLSLLMIASKREEPGIERLKESFRRSDEIVALDKWHSAVILRETNIDGTINALNRYKSFNNVIHLRFAVVCYPNDGWNAQYILDSANDRIARAMHGPAGAVVC